MLKGRLAVQCFLVCQHQDNNVTTPHHTDLSLQHAAWVCTAGLQSFLGQNIEGYDPCPSGYDTSYSSQYQVVASKPSSASDFAPEANAGRDCLSPVQVCASSPDDVERQCRLRADCVAFNWDGKCGYLKTATDPRTPRAGWTVYVLNSTSPPPTTVQVSAGGVTVQVAVPAAPPARPASLPPSSPAVRAASGPAPSASGRKLLGSH